MQSLLSDPNPVDPRKLTLSLAEIAKGEPETVGWQSVRKPNVEEGHLLAGATKSGESLFPHLSDTTGQSGFSLVEVVLAVGIVAFAFVGIMGLLPAGMAQFRGTIDTTVCARIAQRVINDAQQTDFDTLIDEQNLGAQTAGSKYFAFRAPKVTQPEFRYFDERGGEIVPSSVAGRSSPQALTPAERAVVVYQVNVRVMPQTPVPEIAGEDKGGRDVATLTIEVANNPANRELRISNAARDDGREVGRQLFERVPGISILTYSAQIARNN